MSAPRRIYVDDTDPSIQYSANQWFAHDINQLNKLGNLGDVWNGTSKSTSTDGATMSFAFNGTSIQLLGTIQTVTDAAGNVDPTYVCLVDQIPISNGTNPSFKFPENNWILCDQPTLLPGLHTLTVKVQTKGQPFYADSIIYTPLPGMHVDGAVVEYPFSDSSITYGPGWQFYTVENTQNITQTNGAQVSFDFHGTAVTLTGYVPMELSHNATTAKYSVDNGPATTFTLLGLGPEATTTVFNVQMFSVDSLAAGDHEVVVTYEGDPTKTPLAVKTFFVTNATSPSPPSSSSSSPARSPGPTPLPKAVMKHTSADAIAGGIVAGLAILGLLCAGVLFWWCRRRRRNPRTAGEPFTIEAAEVGRGTGAAAALSQNPFDPYSGSGSTHPATPSQGSPYPYPYRSVGSGTGESSTNPRGNNVSRPSLVVVGPVSSPSSSSGGGATTVEVPQSSSKAQEALESRRRVVVQRHQDSGVRLNTTPSLLLSPRVVELPPDYSQE